MLILHRFQKLKASSERSLRTNPSSWKEFRSILKTYRAIFFDITLTFWKNEFFASTECISWSNGFKIGRNFNENQAPRMSKFEFLKITSDLPQWSGMGLGMPLGSQRMYFIILEHLQNLLKIFTKKQNPPWEALSLM